MAQLKIRIDLGKKAVFGPGKAELLETIQKTGSIRSAAAAMKMSYRRAWMLLKEIESIAGAPVIAARTGGAHGGGAALTELGSALAAQYRKIEQRAAKSVAADLKLLAQMAKGPKR